MKFRTYRLLDLFVLCILAFGLEILTTYLTNSFIGTLRPYPILGLLFTLIAVSRWGWLGLIVVPFNALGNFIAGRFMLRTESFRQLYSWSTLVFSFVSNCAALISLAYYKKKTQKEVLKDSGNQLTMILTVCAISYVVNVILVFFANLFNPDVTITFNVFASILYTQFFWNIMGYVCLLIGFMILNKQGVFFNVKEKLLEQKKEAINEKKYYNDIHKNQQK